MTGSAETESFVRLLESGRFVYAGSNGGMGRAQGAYGPIPTG